MVSNGGASDVSYSDVWKSLLTVDLLGEEPDRTGVLQYRLGPAAGFGYSPGECEGVDQQLQSTNVPSSPGSPSAPSYRCTTRSSVASRSSCSRRTAFPRRLRRVPSHVDSRRITTSNRPGCVTEKHDRRVALERLGSLFRKQRGGFDPISSLKYTPGNGPGWSRLFGSGPVQNDHETARPWTGYDRESGLPAPVGVGV